MRTKVLGLVLILGGCSNATRTVEVPGPEAPLPECPAAPHVDTRTEDEKVEDAVSATIEAYERAGFELGQHCPSRPTVTRAASMEEFRSYGVCGQSETAPSTHCLHLGIDTIFLAPDAQLGADGEPLIRATLQWALYCEQKLGSPDSSDARYWEAAGGEESVQAQARAIFAEVD
ncbi:MAG TPA: hypothetical protein VK524_22280 [Polyangiaceae bacterium]|nr:hypothetical protein [Polyangiaceae bacterium]